MIDERFRKYEPFFGKWKISKELGKGSFGQVFEIYWDDDLGGHSVSALKVIHIPTDEALRNQMELQPNIAAVRNYFLKQVDRIKDEIRILQRCKGHSNIVSYEDHMIVENVGENEIGWDILIRMELLYPLNSFFAREDATQYDVIQMWLDITNALIYCEDQNIIHRDIKPANILRSDSGRFKLSDFGVARKCMETTEASTRVGTEKYMAPEVYKNQKYDKRADYYSLGCVIYYFLNKKRHVFMPPYPEEVTAEDGERAESKRIKGENIPRIKEASAEVNEILLKSMAYNPKKRYKSAKELYRAIQILIDSQGEDLRHKFLSVEENASLQSEISKKTRKGTRSQTSLTKKNSSRSSLPIAVAGVFLIAGVGGIVYGLYSKKEQKLTIVMNSVVNEQGILQTSDSQIRLQGTSKSGSRLVLHVNDQEEILESDGKWEYSLPVDDLEDQADNNIYVSYEDGSGQSEVLEFKVDSTAEFEEETEPPLSEDTIISDSDETPTPAPVETESQELTATPEPTATPTPEPTATSTPTPEPTATSTPTPEPTATSTPTPEPTATSTPTPEPTATSTPTPEPTATSTPTPEPTATSTPTPEPTATSTPTPTPSPSPTPSPTPIPTTRAIGTLERPADGDSIETDLKIKGWVLTSDQVGDVDIYADFVSDGQIVQSYLLGQDALGENTFEKRQKKNEAEIAAAKGYEMKGSYAVENVPNGTYDLQLRIVDQSSGKEDILETIKINVAGAQERSSGDVLAFMGVEEENKELSTHYLYDDMGFALSVDVDEKDPVISANPNQILLTGWVNAEKGTSLGMFFEIDSEVFTADALVERGGSFTIVRVPRYLDQIDRSLTGAEILDTDEAGYIISLQLPFLDDGEHSLAVSFNVGVPGEETELVDILPLTLKTDSSVAINEKAEEQITAEWAAEFPQPTATPTPEPTETPAADAAARK